MRNSDALVALAGTLLVAGCAAVPPAEPAQQPLSRAPSASAPAVGEVDCRAIQATGPDSPAFGLLVLALAGSPDPDVAAAAHNVMVAHAAVFDDPAAAPLVEIPLTTLRIRCQLAYPAI